MTILRKTLALLLCLCAVAGLFGCQNPTEPTFSGEPAQVKVMTLNVAYYDGVFTNNQHLKDLAYPGQTKEQDYTFAERADRLRSLLKFYTPDVFYLNEFNFAWWKEVITDPDAILKELTQYNFVGCPSVGLTENGEGENYLDLYSLVFYDQTRFELLDSGNFTILQRKAGWYDHCNWAKLRDKTTGQVAIYAATHMPTVPDTQWAVKCVQATTTVAQELANVAGDLPIVLGGDFNTTEKSRGYHTYQYLVSAAGYQDARYAAPNGDNCGTARIWGTQLSNNGSRIDYIFVNGAGVTDYKVASGAFLADDTYVEQVTAADLKSGQYYDISDHLPVVAIVELSGGKSTAPQAYDQSATDNRPEAKPTGSYTENGGTAEKLTFHFADALKYLGNVKKQGFEASLVTDETYGTVLKIQAGEHITSGAISIDYGALMADCGLTPINTKEYSLVKITYLANASYSLESGILRLGMLKKGMNIVAETNSLGLKTYGKWVTQNMVISLLPGPAQGELNALTIYNAEGALQGDAIYIASIEFVK